MALCEIRLALWLIMKGGKLNKLVCVVFAHFLINAEFELLAIMACKSTIHQRQLHCDALYSRLNSKSVSNLTLKAAISVCSLAI
jgi:hypothetical protein